MLPAIIHRPAGDAGALPPRAAQQSPGGEGGHPAGEDAGEGEQGEQPLHQWAGLGLGDRHPSRARHSSQARGSTEIKIVNSELNTFQELWKC